MSTVWIAVLVLAAPPVAPLAGNDTPPATINSPAAAADEKPLVEPRRGVELRKAVHEGLRRWARPSDQEADAAAREFLVFYRELQRDDQLPQAQREQLRTTVRSRLLKLAEQINKRVAIEKRLAKDKQPASVSGVTAGKGVLAQWGGMGGQGMGMGGQGMGMGVGGMGGNGLPDDNGEQLVDLIQKTIAPTTWDVNGGPGSIYYWRPGLSIIVSNSQDVHEELNDLLEQLRRAGN